MVKLITCEDVSSILSIYGLSAFLLELMEELKKDFSKWDEFQKVPRLAHHTKDGVLELMPVGGNDYYSFKMVNGHPNNPHKGKQTVVASGMLLETEFGQPLMISEMTILTALRTAATSALVSDIMSRKDSSTIAIIGTGAQSEFQILAHQLIRTIKEVRYFDTDPNAMNKFENNMRDNQEINFIRCRNTKECVNGADIIIVVTATKNQVQVLKDDWVKEGVHINGLGGDCPGKTEIEMEVLRRADKVVVEFFEQSFIEGEIQHFQRDEALKIADTHLHEIITGEKKGRETDTDITLFDSVGFALEDYSTLNLTYRISNKLNLGKCIDIIPTGKDPKNLIGNLNAYKEKAHFIKAE